MIKSPTGIATRFFKENKMIALTTILGVMISTSLIITMIMFISNAKQSLIVDITIDDELLKANLDVLYHYMIVLSVLVIIITALFIISNFEHFLYKYKHELAVLRSIGALRRQVFKITFQQSALINILGSFLAIVFSFMMYNYLQKAVEKFFSLKGEILSFHFGIALLVAFISMSMIQLFMLIPAFRSSRVLPITLMQENEEIEFSHLGLRKKICFSVLGISTLFIFIGSLSTDAPILIVFGSVGFLLSSMAIVPIYSSILIRKFLPIVRRIFGNIVFVSLKSALPQVKKNTFILLIISAMMIIVVFGSTLIQTVQKGDEAYIKKQYETEIVMTNRLVDHSSIDVREMTKKIKQLDHITSISTQSKQEMGVITETNEQYYFDYSFADLSSMQEQGLLENPSTNYPQDVIVKDSYAKEHGINVGNKIKISLQYSNEQQEFIQNGEIMVTGIVKNFPYPNEIRDVLIDWNSKAVDSSFITFETAYIETSNPQLALEELEELKAIYPEIQVNSLERSLQQSKEMGVQIWTIFILVLVVILINIMFGVMNTFIHNLNSKRKEFAVLRAIYMGRKDIIHVIMTQVTTYITFGILLGVSLGMIFTYFISLVDPGILSFNFPLITMMSMIIFILAYIVLIPFASRLGQLNISEELMQGNR